jgi:hypothetical protein
VSVVTSSAGWIAPSWKPQSGFAGLSAGGEGLKQVDSTLSGT